MPTIQSQIATIQYFDGITGEELAYLADQSLLRDFAPGETIFLEAEPAAGLWLVEQGHVKIYKLSLDGSEHILHLQGPGKSFNEIAALDAGPNPATASALGTQVRLWLIPSAAIQHVLAHNPPMAANVIRMLAARVRSLVDQIEDLALHSVIVRLARFLLKQAEDPSLSGPGVTRTAMAAHIGTTPQTVSNLLRTLEAAGAIDFDRQRILIVDEQTLRAIAMIGDRQPAARNSLPER